MRLLPAIDLYEGKGVRLLHGDYRQMTVYTADPLGKAREIEAVGASWIHLVDLEGARDGTTPNFDIVAAICRETGLQVEVGGGIRSLETMARYAGAGVRRMVLGTRAVTDDGFLREAVAAFGEAVAVGLDVRDGEVAIRGWLASSGLQLFDFLPKLAEIGVQTVIVTDIARDGALQGTNVSLYRELKERCSLRVIASGGVSAAEDLRALRSIGVDGAILGRAMYTGALPLAEALRAAEGEEA